MKKENIVVYSFFALIMAILIIFGVIFFKSNKEDVSVVKSKSYFSDFHIEDGKVEIVCEITLKNTYSKVSNVNITALFPDDVGKLLTEEYLTSKNEDGSLAVFAIPAKSEKTFTVSFLGNFAGIPKKHDRYLPELQLTIHPVN